MTIKIEKSKELKGLIEQYQKERDKMGRHREKSDKQAEEIERELEKKKQELEQAMDATLEQASEANLAKERELRRKIAELELDLAGAKARRSRAFKRGSDQATAIAEKAVELAKKEAQELHDKHIAEVKKRVEDAKYEYLKSLIAYKQFTDDVGAIFFETIREVDQSNTKVQRPHIEELRPFLDARYYGNYHGIFDYEINAAYKHGKIERGSVRPEREIY